MSKVRVNAYSVSLDGFGAGPSQTLQNPLGEGGMGLHTWFIGTQSFQRQHGDPTAVAHAPAADENFAEQSMANLGAWIMGRHMFTHERGDWTDNEWKGWWGPNPPYHCPVYVLTHHARPSLEMEGGTVFHFVTDGIHSALEQARAVAGNKDIRIGGGASTIRQYLEAGLIDELHVAISPILLGRGEPLWAGLDLPALGYKVSKSVATEKATHIVLTR